MSRWPNREKIVAGTLWGIFGVVVAALALATKPWTVAVRAGDVDDLAKVYEWWAAAINLLPLALLALTARWWLRPLPGEFRAQAPRRLPRGFLPVVAGAMAVFAVTAGFRLNHSLWHDEDYALRHSVLGGYKTKADGTTKLKELPWSRTLWGYRRATNHVFQSSVSRVSLAAWRALARPHGLQLNEVAIRLPCYFAAMAGLAAIALLAARAGLPWAGALAAWFLAIHPWYMALGSEARGYAFVFLLLPCLALALLRAMESGAWRWWLTAGACQFLLLYSWPLTVFAVLVANLAVVFWLVVVRFPGGARGVPAGRWLVCGLVAAMAFFQLTFPIWPQFLHIVETTQHVHFYDAWPKNVLTQLFFGSYWVKAALVPSPYLEFLPHAQAHPAGIAIAAGIMSAFLVAGVFRFVRCRPHGPWLLAFFFVPGTLTLASAVVKQEYLFEWYFAYMLPGLAVVGAAGAIWGLAPLTRIHRAVPVLACALLLALYGLVTIPPRAFLLKGSKECFRESARLTRPDADPNAPANAHILTVWSVLGPEAYDPLAQRAKSAAAYVELMQEADRRQAVLFVNDGMPHVLGDLYPDVRALLDNRKLFAPPVVFRGDEPDHDRVVYRYIPGSVARLSSD